MKTYVFISGLICSVLLILGTNAGFAITTEDINRFDFKADINLIQLDSSEILLAKQEKKTNKHQNESKMGVGTGKGQGLEHRQDGNKDGDVSKKIDDLDANKNKKDKGKKDKREKD